MRIRCIVHNAQPLVFGHVYEVTGYDGPSSKYYQLAGLGRVTFFHEWLEEVRRPHMSRDCACPGCAAWDTPEGGL